MRPGVRGANRKERRADGCRDAPGVVTGARITSAECYIPALDHFTVVKEPVEWTWAFEGPWLFYKLRGCLPPNPDTPAAVFQAEFNRRSAPSGPLIHYERNSFVANPQNLFHWALVRGEVAQDVTVARAAVGGTTRQT